VTDASGPIGVLSVSDLLGALPRSPVQRKHVRHVMSWGYVACSPETPIPSALLAMIERDSRSLIVLGKDGSLVGVVTGFDLIAAITGDGHSPENVGGYVNSGITTTPDTPIKDAVDLMIQKFIHRVVVVASDRPSGPPIGILSTTDIMVEMGSADSTWQT
jgi:CBS domain-containing protein